MFTFIHFSIAGPSITATPERESDRFYLVQNGWEAQSSWARSWDLRSDILRCCFSVLWKCLCLAAFDVANLHGNSIPIARLSSHWQNLVAKAVDFNWKFRSRCSALANVAPLINLVSQSVCLEGGELRKVVSQRRWINSACPSGMDMVTIAQEFQFRAQPLITPSQLLPSFRNLNL